MAVVYFFRFVVLNPYCNFQVVDFFHVCCCHVESELVALVFSSFEISVDAFNAAKHVHQDMMEFCHSVASDVSCCSLFVDSSEYSYVRHIDVRNDVGCYVDSVAVYVKSTDDVNIRCGVVSLVEVRLLWLFGCCCSVENDCRNAAYFIICASDAAVCDIIFVANARVVPWIFDVCVFSFVGICECHHIVVNSNAWCTCRT